MSDAIFFKSYSRCSSLFLSSLFFVCLQILDAFKPMHFVFFWIVQNTLLKYRKLCLDWGKRSPNSITTN